MRLAPVLLALSFLPGCAGVVAIDATRKESRVAILKTLAAERPGLPDAAADCVLEAMTVAETLKLGLADNSHAISAENRASILSYADRPEAADCIGALSAGSAG